MSEKKGTAPKCPYKPQLSSQLVIHMFSVLPHTHLSRSISSS